MILRLAFINRTKERATVIIPWG